MTKRISIIDADSICYRMASATEGRSIEVTHIPTGAIKTFKNRTEFKELLKSKDKLDKIDDYVVLDLQEAEPLENALSLIKRLLTNIEDFLWADKTEIYLGSGKVFRHNLQLPTLYKSNRSGLVKPVHLDDCKDYLIKHWNAKVITEIEADDYVNIRAYEELSKGNIPIVVSIDKDAYSSSGIHVFDYSKEEWELEEIPLVGELYKKGSVFKGKGLKFLAYQILAGDPVDGYKPYELSKVGYGPAKAAKALQDAKTEQDVLRAVISEYKRLYADPVTFTTHEGDEVTMDWKQILEMYFQCAYMKRKMQDDTTAESFFASKGVNLE